jgi:hypothetical protein
LLRAENLNTEVALLSNKLHTFADSDVKGAKVVIDQIKEKRNNWKQVRLSIEHFEQFGKFPDQNQASPELVEGEAELKLTIKENGDKIRKLRWKLKENPSHANSTAWSAEMEMLTADIAENRKQLLRLKYK